MTYEYSAHKLQYLEIVSSRLSIQGFKTIKDVGYGYLRFEHLSKRTKFEFDKFGFVETSFIIHETESDILELRKFSKTCVEYCIDSSRIPLPRGFGKSIFCYSIALVKNVNQTIAKAIQSEEPSKHWAAFEIPVICDLNSCQLYYLESTPSWGSLYWDHIRETICKTLKPEAYCDGT